jgi:hypothetical protein
VSDRWRCAIIPTTGRACLRDAVAAIQPQVDRVALIYTTNTPENHVNTGMWTWDTKEPRNISRWWNRGLQFVQDDLINHKISMQANGFEPRNTDEWDVAILNDDAIVPEGWFEAVSSAMRGYGAAAACSVGGGVSTTFLTEPGPVPGWPNPLTGYAFMLAGEKGLRANEDLHWYFTDNYIDWESRKLGGTVVIPGFPVQHLYPNGQMDPDLQVRTGVDAQVFVDLYGMRPW